MFSSKIPRFLPLFIMASIRDCSKHIPIGLIALAAKNIFHCRSASANGKGECPSNWASAPWSMHGLDVAEAQNLMALLIRQLKQTGMACCPMLETVG